MRPSEALARNIDAVREIIARYPVSNPRIFGSVARGDDTEESDLDILVDPKQDITTYADLGMLCAELELALGTKVDVLTPGGLRPGVASRIASEIVPL